MDWQKNLLLVAIVSCIFLLTVRWFNYQEAHLQEQHAIEQAAAPATPNSNTSASVATASSASSDNFVAPQVPTNNTESASPVITNKVQSAELIKVKTDSLILEIDPYGGDIVRVELPRHSEDIKTPDKPFVLLENNTQINYTAQSGFVGKNATDGASRPTFQTEKNYYELVQGQDSLNIDLIYQQNAIKFTKRFTLSRNNYLIKIQYFIDNQSDEVWSGNFFGRIQHNNNVKIKTAGVGLTPFLGGATTTAEENYKKIKFEDLDKATHDQYTFAREGGWVSLVQHYFISAWIPEKDSKNTYQFYKEKSNYIFQYVSSEFSVAPKTQGQYQTSFYAGPKESEKLKAISPFLDRTVDYGWFWWISEPLFTVLKFIQAHIFSNWGFAIMLLIFGIKFLFFPLSAASYKSMAKLRKLAPKMQELKERYGDDRQKMSQETMKLYQTEKVNPLGGCLPMLIQMPVFLAFYYMLMESVELRHAPFILWIVDLSVKDPFYVLPLIYGITMWVMQKLNPQPADPMQAKIMMFLPVVFTFMFLLFPAGLVLYWITNNTLSIAQQYVITKQIEAEK